MRKRGRIFVRSKSKLSFIERVAGTRALRIWDVSGLDPAENDENDDDDGHRAQDTHRAVPIAVAVAPAEAGEAAQKGDDENDDQDHSERHWGSPLCETAGAAPMRSRPWWLARSALRADD